MGVAALGWLMVAGCVAAGTGALAVRLLRRSPFATQASVLHACTTLLLVLTLAQWVPRSALERVAASPSVVLLPRSWAEAIIPGPPDAGRAAAAAARQALAVVVVDGFAVIWLGGAAYLLLRLVRDVRTVRGIRRRAKHDALAAARGTRGGGLGLRTGPRILVSDETDVPFVCGWRRPAIVLPAACANWKECDWQSILGHEMAHVIRGDVASHLLRQVVLSLHWCNPAVRWLVRAGEEASESACDDAALAGGADAASYVETLLSFVSVSPSHAVELTPTILGRGGLERRLFAMCDVRPRSAAASKGVLLCRVIGVCGGLALAAAEPRVAFARAYIASTVDDAAVAVVAPSVQPANDTTEALLALGAALADPNPIVAATARRALGSWRTRDAYSRLALVARDDNPVRQRSARAALSAIGGPR